MNKDLYDLNNDFETARYTFLSSVGKDLLESLKDRKNVEFLINNLRKLSGEELKSLAIEHFWKIESGSINLSEANRLELELAIIFFIVPPDLNQVDGYWQNIKNHIKPVDLNLKPQKILIEVAAYGNRIKKYIDIVI